MRDLLEITVGMFVLAILFVAVILGSVFGCNYLIGKPACADFGRISGMQTNYSVGNGCLVNSPEGWVDREVITSKKQEVTVKQK